MTYDRRPVTERTEIVRCVRCRRFHFTDDMTGRLCNDPACTPKESTHR